MTLGSRQERLNIALSAFLSIMAVWGDWMTVMRIRPKKAGLIYSGRLDS